MFRLRYIASAMVGIPVKFPSISANFARNYIAQRQTDSLRVDFAMTQKQRPRKKMQGFNNNISALSPLCHSGKISILYRFGNTLHVAAIHS